MELSRLEQDRPVDKAAPEVHESEAYAPSLLQSARMRTVSVDWAGWSPTDRSSRRHTRVGARTIR